MTLTIKQAQPQDCATIGRFIRLIAEYEKMSDDVIWDDATLYDQLFVEHRAEVLLGYEGEEVVGFALYFPASPTVARIAGTFRLISFVGTWMIRCANATFS